MTSNKQIALLKVQETIAKGFRHLDLSYLHLSIIPEEVFELETLISLDLRGNYLYDIPDSINKLYNLQELDLSENFLDIQAIGKIHRIFEIRFLNIEKNPFVKKIPPEIASKDLQAIIDYFKYLESAKKSSRLHEAKVLFVGNGEVGKTTIMKKLMSPELNVKIGDEKTTHGIFINRWQIRVKSTRQFFDKTSLLALIGQKRSTITKINLNLWDFGGQEIYHSTHQFFLTRRSLYILVWEARKEEDYSMFDYWLNVIKYLSESSPVIIVMNKSDVRLKQIDEDLLKRKFPNIITFLSVSCTNNTGLQELTKCIKKGISKLPHINDSLPESWKKIRTEIKGIRKNFISFSEYYQICKSYFFDHEQALFLSEYLHDLGIIVHFSKDNYLRNTVILNPEWATSAVYALIDNRKIQKNHGRFHLDQLSIIWNQNVYPPSKHFELIRLMEKFELVFNLTRTSEYIIPELLPNFNDFHFGSIISDDKLCIEYRYNFMPSGLIGRLICRLHHLIESNKFWKNGVILNYEDTKAQIISESINKKITVTITGLNKSQLLSIIRHEIYLIHSSLNLKTENDYYEMIPCNCTECKRNLYPIFFKHSTLKRYISKGKEVIVCEKTLEDVNISEIMYGYEIKTRENDLLYIILSACAKLQGHSKIVSTDEDSRNTYIASLIETEKYVSKDQSRWGRSASGIKEGELDIKIEGKNRIPKSIFEGFILKCFNKIVIDQHLNKIFNYDPNGLHENYVVIYSESKDFIGSWEKYFEYLKMFSFQFPINFTPVDVSSKYGFGSEIKIAKTKHNRNGELSTLIHIMLNLS